MIAKFNPTGTHIHKGFLKVRIDLYPDVSSKTYSMHYVDKPVRPYTEEELADESLQALVQKHKVLNPCLCHFITINADTSLGSLISYVRGIFGKDTLSQIDTLLFEEARLEKEIKVALDPRNLIIELNNRRRELVLLMRPKCGIGKVLPLAVDVPKLQGVLNSRFAGLEIEV